MFPSIVSPTAVIVKSPDGGGCGGLRVGGRRGGTTRARGRGRTGSRSRAGAAATAGARRVDEWLQHRPIPPRGRPRRIRNREHDDQPPPTQSGVGAESAVGARLSWRAVPHTTDLQTRPHCIGDLLQGIGNRDRISRHRMAVPVQTARTVTHPLDPLTATELAAVVSRCAPQPAVPDRVRFVTIALDEPSKHDVAAYQPGTPIDRRANVVLARSGRPVHTRGAGRPHRRRGHRGRP